MTPQQQATLTAALSGRVPVWLIVYPDGTTACVLDRAKAEAAALKGAVWVELSPREQHPAEPHKQAPQNEAIIPTDSPQSRANA